MLYLKFLLGKLNSQDHFGLLPLDTQDVEGANSILKRIYTLAPNIKLPLMSARVTIKKGLGDRILHGSKDIRREAISYAVTQHSFARELVEAAPDRFCFLGESADPDILPLQDVMSDVMQGDVSAVVVAETQLPVPPALEPSCSANGSNVFQGRRRKPRQPPPTGIEAVNACATRMAALLQAVGGSDITAGSQACFTFAVTLVRRFSGQPPKLVHLLILFLRLVVVN